MGKQPFYEELITRMPLYRGHFSTSPPLLSPFFSHYLFIALSFFQKRIESGGVFSERELFDLLYQIAAGFDCLILS